MSFITKEEIYAGTNNGLDIILDLYPDARDSVYKPNRHFKARDEDTPSAKLLKFKDGTYGVIDFGGGDNEPLKAIELYMKESMVDWPRAMQELAAKYRIEHVSVKPIESQRTFRKATEEEKDGDWHYNVREKWTDEEITYLLSKNTLKYIGWFDKKEGAREAAYSKIVAKFKYYNYYSLVSYSIVKNRNVTTFLSSSDYPIYLIDEGEYKKLHQPKNPEKQYRFMSQTGTKPKHFIHGLKQLQKEFNKKKEDLDDDQKYCLVKLDRGVETESKSKGDPRIPQFFLLSGGSDAINAAVLGYQVCWLNSETEKLEEWQYATIVKMVKQFYQIMDIDATGLAQAHERCLKYLDLLNIELPTSLLVERDSRGYQCSDFRDYLNFYDSFHFAKLISTALPYRFWDEKAKYNKSGAYTGMEYDFNNVHAYNFLQKNGFYRLAIGDKTDEFQYIKIEGNTVSETNPVKIRGFIKNFLRDRNADIALRNAIFRTTQLSESSLTNIDDIELDFKDFTPFSQFMFFKNKTIEITGSKIIEHKAKTIDRYIWDEDVYDHRFKQLEAPFIIKKDEAGAWDIEIKDYSCLYLRYLIQTSRIHWKTELETNLESSDMKPVDRDKYLEENKYRIDGPLLSAEEIDEQKQHLMNKLFAMGYLLHRYKSRAKAWMVVATDGKISLDGQSHGRSGKSIFLDNAIRSLLKKNFMLNGRDPRLDQNTHKYEGVTEHTRYIFIEDAHKYLNIDVFYPDITGDIAVNPKGKKAYTIPFAKAGKLSMSTNFVLRNMGPSTFGRILYTVFSDYYHEKAEGSDYREKRDPSMEFGKQLFDDFTEAEWNLFYNTAVYALSFYLSTKEKITPAMDNVNTRNVLEAIGPEVKEWGTVYFSDESDNLDRFLIREEIFADFNFHYPKSKLTPYSWKERLDKFCQLQGFVLNPKHLLNKDGTIIKKVDPRVYSPQYNQWTETQGKKVAKEHFYIQTDIGTMDEFNTDVPEDAPIPVNTPEQINLDIPSTGISDDDDPF